MTTHHFIVSGKVQGVWYRKSVQRAAQAEGFSGYVRNLPDGTVEAEVTCKPERLELFETILRRGSSASRVDDIARSTGREIHSGPFEVR